MSPTTFTAWRMVTVKGDRASHFLQGQLTADVHQINATQAIPFCHCNKKGRVITLGWGCMWRNTYALLLPHPHLQHWLDQVALVAKLSRVTLQAQEDVSLWMTPHPNTTPGACQPQSDTVRMALHANSNLALHIGTFDTAQPPSTALSDEAWRIHCIQHGWPLLNSQHLETFTPQMLNAIELNMVSFTKGCFLGQEIVARTQHLGKRKRALYGLYSDTPIAAQPGDKIMGNQQELGTVTACQTAHHTTWVQAVLSVDLSGQSLTLHDQPLHLQPLPYTLQDKANNA